MAKLLKEEHIRGLLTMKDALSAVEDAFRAVARGEAVNVPRQRGALRGATINAMGAMSAAHDLMAMKIYPIVRKDVTVGSSFQVLAYRMSDGALVGVLEAEALAQVRTGAASGIATKYMARSDSRIMTIFGAGWQAQTQLEAIALVLPELQRVNVIGRSPERVRAFCSEMGRRVRVELTPGPDPERALAESDVVTTVTGAAKPVFDGRWLAPGTHVNGVGSNFAEKQELDATTVRRASHIVADDVAVARIECGDLLTDEARDAFDWKDVHPLSDVVAGKVAGRGSAQDITLFESQGIGLEDLAMASLLLDRAERCGAGIDIPLK